MEGRRCETMTATSSSVCVECSGSSSREPQQRRSATVHAHTAHKQAAAPFSPMRTGMDIRRLTWSGRVSAREVKACPRLRTTPPLGSEAGWGDSTRTLATTSLAATTFGRAAVMAPRTTGAGAAPAHTAAAAVAGEEQRSSSGWSALPRRSSRTEPQWSHQDPQHSLLRAQTSHAGRVVIWKNRRMRS